MRTSSPRKKLRPYQTPYQLAHPTEKEVMKKIIDDIESAEKKKFQETKINNFDMSQILPESLQKRVGKITNLSEFTDLKPDNEENDFEETAQLQRRESKPFNESTISEILDRELEYVQINLNIEPPPESRKPVRKPVHWLANFLRQPRKDRVVWPSKLYHFDRKFSQKTLFEQAEQLMDLAAEDFADWLNGLGSENESNLNKEIIKQLFSIGIEGDASKALYVEPKPKKSIPHEVAQSLEMPLLSIEYNVARMLTSDEENKNLTSKKFAFGTALPKSLRVHKSGLDVIPPLQPDFPHDLRTKRTVFKGITHLRSTKTMVNYINENPHLAKPTYLVGKGTFVPEEAVTLKNHVPLYEYFIKKEL